MRAATAETARVGELVEAVESDVALTIAVLRFANRSGAAAGGVAAVPEAIDVLKPSGVLAIAGTAPSLRLLRVQRRLGAETRALPGPRPRHPARRRRDRPRDRLGRSRRARRRRAPARRRPARDLPPAPRLQDLLRRRLAHARAAASATSATSSASTTPWSAASWPGAGTCRSGSRSRSSAIMPRTPKGWPGWSRSPTWSPTTPRARRSRRSGCEQAPSAAGSATDGLRDLLYELP